MTKALSMCEEQQPFFEMRPYDSIDKLVRPFATLIDGGRIVGQWALVNNRANILEIGEMLVSCDAMRCQS